MEVDCIPAGMELFPAADEEQWELIRKIINEVIVIYFRRESRKELNFAHPFAFVHDMYDDQLFYNEKFKFHNKIEG